MKKLVAITFIVGFFYSHLVYAQQPDKEGFIFDNQSDNIEVSASAIAKVNIVCSKEFDYKIRLIPDENLGKIHMRLIDPKNNIILYDNAKDNYNLQKVIKLEKSMVIMMEASIVMTEDDEDNPDFVSHGWVAMLIKNRSKK